MPRSVYHIVQIQPALHQQYTLLQPHVHTLTMIGKKEVKMYHSADQTNKF